MWRATPALIIALDERFGEPTDAYVNGSQTWLRDDGPGGATLEWRLHPVAAYQRPEDLDTYEVFSAVALALGTGGEVPAPLESMWDGLEAFPAYDDEIEPAPLAAAVEEALGIEPDAAGLVDHAAIGDQVGTQPRQGVDHRRPARRAQPLSPYPTRTLRRSRHSSQGWSRGGSKRTSTSSPRMAAKACLPQLG